MEDACGRRSSRLFLLLPQPFIYLAPQVGPNVAKEMDDYFPIPPMATHAAVSCRGSPRPVNVMWWLSLPGLRIKQQARRKAELDQTLNVNPRDEANLGSVTKVQEIPRQACAREDAPNSWQGLRHGMLPAAMLASPPENSGGY
jgi:hypothetical protein